jgi:hypothetical protein
LADLLNPASLAKTFESRIADGRTVSRLTAGVSAGIIDALWKIDENQRGLSFVARALGPKTFRDGFALQQEAVDLALRFFGHPLSSSRRAIIPKISETSLASFRLLEDTVIEHDARSIPGMRLVRSDVTGFAEFEGAGDRLRVYTANKRPLEALFGVDLLYLNLNIGNMVLVQYKMLERTQGNSGADWIYRPDNQLDDEINRMDRFRQPAQGAITGYRLNPEAFYMRFVKREASTSTPAITMPIDHFKAIRANMPGGPRGGLRISYEALNGHYMREAGLVDLVKAGYIGCHCETTAAFEALIREILQDGNATVAAIQGGGVKYGSLAGPPSDRGQGPRGLRPGDSHPARTISPAERMAEIAHRRARRTGYARVLEYREDGVNSDGPYRFNWPASSSRPFAPNTMPRGRGSHR